MTAKTLRWLAEKLRRFLDAQLVGSDVYEGIRTSRRQRAPGGAK